MSQCCGVHEADLLWLTIEPAHIFETSSPRFRAVLGVVFHYGSSLQDLQWYSGFAWHRRDPAPAVLTDWYLRRERTGHVPGPNNPRREDSQGCLWDQPCPCLKEAAIV